MAAITEVAPRFMRRIITAPTIRLVTSITHAIVSGLSRAMVAVATTVIVVIATAIAMILTASSFGIANTVTMTVGIAGGKIMSRRHDCHHDDIVRDGKGRPVAPPRVERDGMQSVPQYTAHDVSCVQNR